MKIFYHIDGDGMCAGFWVYEMVKRMINSGKSIHSSKDLEELEFIKMNYNYDVPLDRIKRDEFIYIVDFSIDPADMEKLLSITGNVIWIDHHKTAIEKYSNFKRNIPGLRYDGIAGCMLTYCYFNHMVNPYDEFDVINDFDKSMTEDAPWFTKYIADYDVWTFEYGDDTRNFRIALGAEENTEPNDEIWNTFLHDNDRTYVNKFIEDGKAMRKYASSFASKYCTCKGFDATFEGYSAFVTNVGLAGSDWFDPIENSDRADDYQLYISFSLNPSGDWGYSLRSSKIDVSELAVKYGGGGHKGAAGFHSDRCLFEKKKTFIQKLKDLFRS